jgi:hypothetical protein
MGADEGEAPWPAGEARSTPCQLDESLDVLDYAGEEKACNGEEDIRTGWFGGGCNDEVEEAIIASYVGAVVIWVANGPRQSSRNEVGVLVRVLVPRAGGC